MGHGSQAIEDGRAQRLVWRLLSKLKLRVRKQKAPKGLLSVGFVWGASPMSANVFHVLIAERDVRAHMPPSCFQT